MPFVNIRVAREVIADDPAGKKAKIAEKIATAISDTTGVGKNDVWVVFEEVAAKDWYVGGDERGGAEEERVNNVR